MIVFHEGLPGAGKSYESCVMHIIPALKAGRRVITNIEGINHDKFSQVTSIPSRYIQQNLISIDYPDIEDPEEKCEKQKRAILELSENDSLIVVDEIQDLFPSERKKLGVEWSKYVGSHRHDGNDIILMGQSFKDMHTYWRRRVQRKIVFTKKTALGQDNTYLWESYEASQPEKFNKVTSGTRNYDKKYFGLYHSVTSKTSNLDVYADKRVVVWNTPTFKYALPVAFCCAFFAVNFLFDFFSTPSLSSSSKKDISKHSASSQLASRQIDNKHKSVKPNSDRSPDLHSSSLESNSESNSDSSSQSEQYDPIDVFDDLANRYKPRLSGYIRSSDKLFVRVQILDSSDHVKDIFSHDDLIDMGWTLTYRPSGLNVKKGDREYLIRPWPVDSWGSVNRGTSAALGSNRVAVSTPRAAVSSKPNAILISHSPRPRSQFSSPTRRH